MRVFTKLLKLQFSILKSYGYLSVVIFDDFIFKYTHFSTCEENIKSTDGLL